MATYKVIQDIEAEDKFLGPLTLKQFIFGAAGVFFIWLNIFALQRGATWLLALFVPPMLFAFFMAIPWSKDQSTELWVLAKLRFYFKPRVRIWDQTGLQELVTITAPKKIEKQLTNNLSQGEVVSRLQALADTIDSRGWAVKNASFEAAAAGLNPHNDRLVNPTLMPKAVPEIDPHEAQDMFESSAVSSTFDYMLQVSAKAQKEEALDKLDRARSGESIESINEPPVQFTPPPPSYAPPGAVTLEEEELSRQLREKQRATPKIVHGNTLTVDGKLRVADENKKSEDKEHKAKIKKHKHDKGTREEKPQAAMTQGPTPAILNLAQNDDLNVATIARQAEKATQKPQEDGEVVISLH